MVPASLAGEPGRRRLQHLVRDLAALQGRVRGLCLRKNPANLERGGRRFLLKWAIINLFLLAQSLDRRKMGGGGGGGGLGGSSSFLLRGARSAGALLHLRGDDYVTAAKIANFLFFLGYQLLHSFDKKGRRVRHPALWRWPLQHGLWPQAAAPPLPPPLLRRLVLAAQPPRGRRGQRQHQQALARAVVGPRRQVQGRGAVAKKKNKPEMKREKPNGIDSVFCSEVCI